MRIVLLLALTACSINVSYPAGGTACTEDADCSDGFTCDGTVCVANMAPGAACAAAVGTGGGHACAVRTDGVAFCWGDNAKGQLGNNSTALSDVPVQVGNPATGTLPALTAISGGGQHTCALDVDGGVWCWGDNGEGQLGVGTPATSGIPVKVSLSGKATRVVTGAVHSCALLDGGTIMCWGNNDAGQLGNGSSGNHSATPTTVGLTGAIGLAAASYTTCGVGADHVPQCWGNNGDGQFGNGVRDSEAHPAPIAMMGLSNAVDVAVGDDFACAQTDAGEVYCSGHNDLGQSGEAFDDRQLTPNKVALITKAQHLSAGGHVGCAIDAGAQLWCWGGNGNSELADGTNQNHAFPVRPMFPDAKQVSIASGSGGTFVCVVSSDGLRCAGFNGTGQLGNGAHTVSNAPVPVTGLTGVQALALGDSFSCALMSDATAQCWGANWGGQLGDGTWTSRGRPAPVAGLSTIKKISAGTAHACALLMDGTVACWGANDSGELGDGSTDWHSQPVKVTTALVNNRPSPTLLGNVVDIAAADRHTCAVIDDGTIRCWGANQYRQVGDGTTNVNPHPTPFKVAPATGMMGAVSIVAGGAHACVIDKVGKVWCWGANGSGELGVPGVDVSATPVLVSGLDEKIDRLTSFADFTCAHSATNKAWCWGLNNYGQLGIEGNKTYAYDSAQLFANLAVSQIAAGGIHACAIATDGATWCWAANYLGQTTADVYDAVAHRNVVAGLTGATAIATGGAQSCALVAEGKVQCWGDNRDGALGNGVIAEHVPVTPKLVCPEK